MSAEHPDGPRPSTGRRRLRELPVFGDELPDPALGDERSTDPMRLVASWLDEAIVSGVAQPHVATLATVGPDGDVSARSLLVKDLDADAIWFSSSAHSPKGRDLAAHPDAALTLYWRELGRQLRLGGPVDAPSTDVSARDFLDRSRIARREMLVDRQSEPMEDDADELLAAADARLDAEPDAVAPSWRAYRLRPERVEFWAARSGRAHLRIRYDRRGTGWERRRLWT